MYIELPRCQVPGETPVKSPSRLFVVVRRAVQDGHGTVELLDEDEPYHLVREGHARHGQLFVGGGIDFGGEAVGAANDEDQPPVDGVHLLPHVFGKLHGAHLLAALVEQHNDIARLKGFQYQVAFLLFLHLGGEALGVLQFGYHFDVERQVAAGALGVVGYGRNEMGLNGSSYDDEGSLHVGVLNSVLNVIQCKFDCVEFYNSL